MASRVIQLDGWRDGLRYPPPEERFRLKEGKIGTDGESERKDGWRTKAAEDVVELLRCCLCRRRVMVFVAAAK